MFLDRQKSHADAIRPRFGQGESEFFALAREEFVGNLDQNAGAVAGLGVAAASAAVREVQKDLDALLDDFVALLA